MIKAEGLFVCSNCGKEYALSDAEEFEEFCCALCESEHRQEWLDFKSEEVYDELIEEQTNEIEYERQENSDIYD